MASSGLRYEVRDRSILLPLYKRLVVAPSLHLVPHGVDPNHITHVGHLLNLAGVVTLLVLGSSVASGAGWPFVIAIACLQLYNLCDNVDGAQARRTGRCSALGELLDHGLDMLNTTYIAYAAAIAVGAPPVWWTAIALVVPAACATTYWEQAETGMFNLGVLNQVESVMTLSLIMAISAAFGLGVWDRMHVGPVTARLVLMTFVCTQATFGMLHNVWRVTQQQRRSAALWRILPLFAFEALVLLAAATGALAPIAAVIVGTAGNVFFGLRSLAMRTAGERPRLESGVLVGAALVLGMIAWKLTGHGGSTTLDVTASVIASVAFGALAVGSARDARREVIRLDRQATAARAVG